MRIGSFEFNMRELSGSMGNYGTLLPIIIGYISICGMDPAGILVVFGIVNIVTGIVYRLPLPTEPMKVIAVVAIAQAWAPEKVYTAAIVMGVVWLLMGVTNAMTYVSRFTPRSVVRGIQISIGLIFVVKGLQMVATLWYLGLISLVIVILLRNSKYAPAAIVLAVLGIVIMGFKGDFSGEMIVPSLTLPPITIFDFREIWPALRDAGFAQIPLTVTNAVIATSALVSDYWPNRRVRAKYLSTNIGIMNLVSPFFGGIAMCHGAGGLAGKHFFGARSGGANIIEGTTQIIFGLFFAVGIAAVFIAFPLAILGTMLFLVGVELIKFGKDLGFDERLLTALITVLGSILFNMGVGFVLGLLVHYIFFRKPRGKAGNPAKER
ncbi:MAG: putative sulfate/molybdate transporter [Deltaproteobacteria bacterium]|uniref:Sulfate/molybdate transporter n=1 Tax=Candidatus Zymogenus saltonus TaxID=2844893 RepID=A0A9D8KLR3_9DELT|nr:putative sulfate/molybdate transporter [Candidatus Zymogenus saltonus]